VEGAFPNCVSKLVHGEQVVARREFPTEGTKRLRPFQSFRKAVAEEVEVEVSPRQRRRKKRRVMTRARAKAARLREDAPQRQRQRQRRKKALATRQARHKVQESPSALGPPATVSLREGDVWARRERESEVKLDRVSSVWHIWRVAAPGVERRSFEFRASSRRLKRGGSK
jgi:hypothetical protein